MYLYFRGGVRFVVVHFDKLLKARIIGGDGAWRSRDMCIRESLIYFIIFIVYTEVYYHDYENYVVLLMNLDSLLIVRKDCYK